MNAHQLEAFAAATAGHNIYVGGQAGSGKSFFVTHLVSSAKKEGKKAALTCTTGIACCVYDSTLKPTTIHKWTGIGDGRYNSEQLRNSMDQDPNYEAAKDRIRNTDILVIDEISMLSRAMLDKLDTIMRHVRQSDIIFGGVQIILVGDFLQLPPVRNLLYNDPGDFCFLSQCFPKHCLFFTESVRHTDELAKIVNAVAVGQVSTEMKETINILNRHLQEDTIKLFPTNLQVDMFNRDKLLEIDGPLYEFRSVDQGDSSHLEKLTVQKTLWLKDCAKVMLLHNLSDHLVNGLQGSVTAVREGEVDVYFPSLQQVTTLVRMPFTVYDPSTNSNLAVRSQIPLKLSYAMTIHKAQGMTLERVEVDCSQIFQPGQLGVAMGRVRTLEGLRIVNFDIAAIIPQPTTVTDFIVRESALMKDDKSCCHIRSESDTCKANDEQDRDMINDEEVDEVIRDIVVDYQCPLASLDYKELHLQSLSIESPSNNTQQEYNSILNFLLNHPEKSKVFFETQHLKISKMFNEKTSLVAFYKAFQEHITSDNYKSACFNFFPDKYEQKSVFLLSYKIMSKIREMCVTKESAILPLSESGHTLSARKLDDNIKDTARGKVRYVGGYVVAKLFYANAQKIKQSAFKSTKQNMDTYEQGKHTVQYLNMMKATESTLFSSNYKETLTETKRKQNINNGLTNITDSTYEFFMLIVSKLLNLLTHSNLSAHGSSIYAHVLDTLESDTAAYQCFISLFSDMKLENISPDYMYNHDNNDVQSCMDNIVLKVCVQIELFHTILKKTVLVFLKQFTNDIKNSMDIKKKMEHRKEVRVSAPKHAHTLPEITDSSSCAKCNKVDIADRDWICCDKCNKWLHRKCAGLSTASKWNKYKKAKLVFTCYMCN